MNVELKLTPDSGASLGPFEILSGVNTGSLAVVPGFGDVSRPALEAGITVTGIDDTHNILRVRSQADSICGTEAFIDKTIPGKDIPYEVGVSEGKIAMIDHNNGDILFSKVETIDTISLVTRRTPTWPSTYPSNTGTTNQDLFSVSGDGEHYYYYSNITQKIYRSGDYGYNFEDITDRLPISVFQVHDLVVSKNGKYVLISFRESAAVNTNFYLSTDYGTSFNAVQLSNSGNTAADSITYEPSVSDDGKAMTICWKGTDNNFYASYSNDYGATFTEGATNGTSVIHAVANPEGTEFTIIRTSDRLNSPVDTINFTTTSNIGDVSASNFDSELVTYRIFKPRNSDIILIGNVLSNYYYKINNLDSNVIVLTFEYNGDSTNFAASKDGKYVAVTVMRSLNSKCILSTNGGISFDGTDADVLASQNLIKLGGKVVFMD